MSRNLYGIYNVDGSTVNKTSGLLTKSDSVLVADDGTISMPLLAEGFLTVFTDAEFIECFVKKDGTVIELRKSANAVLTDTDTKLCVYKGTGQAVVKNRLGSEKLVRYCLEYREGDSFSIQIQTTTSPQSFVLPLISGGTFNFVVYWGDGSSNTITSYNQAEATHSYATAGTYDIKMTGTCTRFNFNNGGSKALVKKVLDWADLGFTVLSFYGCSNLNEIKKPLCYMASMTSFYRLYQNCISLTTIISGMFDNNTQISTNGLQQVYQGCSGLNCELDPNLFANLVNCTSVSNSFNNCSNLRGSGLAFIAACPASITGGTTTDCFIGCTSLSDYASIPAEWK